jgi:hypothetical protein
MTGSVFSPDSLEANRRGQLSSSQERDLRDRLDRWRGWGPAVLLVTRGGLSKDLREGRVLSDEGAIMRKDDSTQGDHVGGPYVDRSIRIGNRQQGTRRFHATKEIFEFTPSLGMVRLYYLPRSRWAVNLERIDRPFAVEELASGTLQEHQQRMRSWMAGWRAADPIGKAERAADITALAREMEAYLPGHAPVPGSQGRRADPASLAAVLVGRWLSPLLTIDIRADGTAAVTGPLADSGAYRGTWSIGADGRLRTDVMGTPMIADAVVSASGDELTLVVGGHPFLGQPFRLRRSMAG